MCVLLSRFWLSNFLAPDAVLIVPVVRGRVSNDDVDDGSVNCPGSPWSYLRCSFFESAITQVRQLNADGREPSRNLEEANLLELQKSCLVSTMVRPRPRLVHPRTSKAPQSMARRG